MLSQSLVLQLIKTRRQPVMMLKKRECPHPGQRLLTQSVPACQNDLTLAPLVGFLLMFLPLAGLGASVLHPLLGGTSQFFRFNR
jgi:hypothetical protein